MAEYSAEIVNEICRLVAEGKTIRQIVAETGASIGSIITWTAKPEHSEQYTRAREAAADLFETDIIEAALSASPETAASDRVKIDALKWVAARRAPKKYGDKVQNEHTGKDGGPIEQAVSISVTFHDPEKAG